MAVWGNNQFVVASLAVLLVGQFALIISYIPAGVNGAYVENSGCVIVSVEQPGTVAALYIVTMILDFVILSLIAYKTYVDYRDVYHRSLIKLIFEDGLVYFVIVFFSNLSAVTLSLLHLNPIMDCLAAGPPLIIATIGACRLVRRLNGYVADTPKIPTM
ncbi:hypothetical protein PM082_014891 [Marasmius tenuissimus]|nr:hypothetical protein PM082_014891 [Marasmius tenuissimus]